MNWHKLYARTVSGAPSSPLIIALHGFGQTVKPVPWWRRWFSPEYLDFAEMTGLVEECEARNWSLWMPQAPFRNWTAEHAGEAGKMVEAAKDATGCNNRPHILGFSDGATIVNRLLFGGVPMSSYVSYEGVCPPILCEPRDNSRSLFICGQSDGSRIRDNIVAHTERSTDYVSVIAETRPYMTCDYLQAPVRHHEWLRCMTSTILDWCA